MNNPDFLDTGLVLRRLVNMQDGVCAQSRRPVISAVEQDRLRSILQPIVPQLFEETGGQQGMPVFGAFTLFDADVALSAIDIPHLQGHQFADPQSGSVANGQQGPVLEIGTALDDLGDFRRAEQFRNALRNVRIVQRQLIQGAL